MRSFHHIFSVSKPKSDLSDKIFIENQLAIKTNQLTDSSQFVFSLYCLYIFLSCYAILDSSNLMETKRSDLL